MRMKRNPCIRRGGCYWVENLNAVGHEMMKTRPAVVVSCGALAGTSPVVNIVYLSNTDKDREGYVRVRTEKGLSVAHCENIYSVDKSRLGTYLGQCGEDEMEKIDAAILRSLGIAAIPAVPQESKAPDTAVENCAFFEPGRRRKPAVETWRLAPAVAKIDYRMIYKLYLQGLTDRVVAEKIGCNVNTVWAWRKKNNLPANRYKKTH